MSGDGLFHIDTTGRLYAMTVSPYAAEDVLQELLASYPDLLAGGQMSPAEPRRWALVRREHGVPDHEEASGARWSLDHLFVDQDAVPTLVEVKRSTDTRIRREVVGQMLDYAANGIRYWSPQSLQTAFEATQVTAGRNPQHEVLALTGEDDLTVEGFFDRVADNLRAGRIRMVFVADSIPDELRRIVEFLNEQMQPAEVFAVEVKQYLAEGYPGTVIVPAVYGRTAAASRKDTGKRIDPEAVRANASQEVRDLAQRMDDLATRAELTIRQTPSGQQLRGRTDITVAQLYMSWATLDISLDPVALRRPEKAAQLFERLRSTTAKRLTVKYPSVPVEDALREWEVISEVLLAIAEVLDHGARRP